MGDTTQSTVPYVMQAAVDLLTPADVLTGVQVAYSFPGDQQEAKSLWFGGVENKIDHDIETMRKARQRREERYTLQLLVEIRADGGDNQFDVDVATFDLAGAVEDLLADDPHLSGKVDGLQWVRPAGIRMDSRGQTGRGYACRLMVLIDVYARLS